MGFAYGFRRGFEEVFGYNEVFGEGWCLGCLADFCATLFLEDEYCKNKEFNFDQGLMNVK